MTKNREEKNTLREVLYHLPIGLLFFNKEKRLSLINPRAGDFFGLKTKKIIGKSILELSKFSKLAPLFNLLGKEIKKVSQEELAIRKNLILEVSSFPILKRGKKIGTLIILVDIGREKKIEQMGTRFISLAAHQLRTPPSAIKWGLKMLWEGDWGKLNKRQKDFLEKIYHCNERMINLIKELSIVARIEEGKYIQKPTREDINKIVQSVIDSKKKEIKRKKVKLRFEKPKRKLPKIFGEVKKLKLAIQNLLENSLRYTRVGGRITISLKNKRRKIELKIKDNGIGIPKNQQKRVFDKFFRGANVMRMGKEGTGLGLFIAKNIIESHQGKIWFESKEKKGTTFYLTLPTEKGRKI